MNEGIIRFTQFDERQLYTVMYKAEHSGGYVGYIRGCYSQTVEDFFREVSCSFRFPYYFGMNWAAFDECLSDLEWLSFSHVLFIIDSAELLFINEKSRKDCVKILLKCLDGTATYWREQRKPFICMINQLRGQFSD